MSNRRKFYEESVKVLKSDAFNSASPEEQEEIRSILKDTYSKIKAREDANIEPTDEEIRAERGTLRNLYGDLEAGHMSLARGATSLAAWTADIAGAKETAGKLDATSAEIAKQMARTSPQASPENLLDFGSQALLQNLPTLAATGLVGRALTGSTAGGSMLANARMAAGIPAIGGAAPLSAGAAQGIATTAMYGIPAMRQANVEAVPGEIRDGNAWQELAAAIPYAAVESYLGVSPAKFVDAFAGKTAGAGISKLFSQYGGKVAKFLEAPLIQLSNKHGAFAAIGAGARWIASNIIGEASEEVVQGIMEIAQPIVAKEGLIPGIQKTIAELKKDSVVQNLMVQAYGGGIVGSILGGAGTIQQKIVALNEAQEEMERKGAAVAELQKLAKARANLEAQMKRLQTAGEKLATRVEEAAIMADLEAEQAAADKARAEEEAAIMADLEAEQAAKDEEKLNLAANLGPEKARLLTLRAKLFNGITNLQEAGPRAEKAKSMAEAREIDYNRASAILQYAMNPVDEQSYNEAVAAFREFPQELQDMVMKDYEAATPEAGQRLAVIPGTWEAKKAAAKQEKAKAKSEKKAARKARLEQQKAQAEQIAKQQAKQLPPDVTVEKVKPTGKAPVMLLPAAKKRGEPMVAAGADGAKIEKRLAPAPMNPQEKLDTAKDENTRNAILADYRKYLENNRAAYEEYKSKPEATAKIPAMQNVVKEYEAVRDAVAKYDQATIKQPAPVAEQKVAEPQPKPAEAVKQPKKIGFAIEKNGVIAISGGHDANDMEYLKKLADDFSGKLYIGSLSATSPIPGEQLIFGRTWKEIQDMQTGRQTSVSVKSKMPDNATMVYDSEKEKVKQPTAPAYKVESYQGGYRVLDPQGNQQSWHTSKQAAETKAAVLNSGKKEADKPAGVDVKDLPAIELPEWLSKDETAKRLAAATGKIIDVNMDIGRGTIEKILPPSQKYPNGSVIIKAFDRYEGKKRIAGQRDTFDFVFLRDRIKRGESRLLGHDGLPEEVAAPAEEADKPAAQTEKADIEVYNGDEITFQFPDGRVEGAFVVNAKPTTIDGVPNQIYVKLDANGANRFMPKSWITKVKPSMRRQAAAIAEATAERSKYESDIPISAAINAHRGTSFSPEKRGESERKAYADHLESARKRMFDLAKTDEQKKIAEEEFERYRAGYRQRYVSILSTKSRTMSPMIVGPAKFPVARNNKALDAEMNKYNELKEWQDKAMRSALKKIAPHRFSVSSDQDNAVELLQKKLADAERLQGLMVDMNKIVKSKKLSDSEKVAQMVATGKINETNAKKLLEKDFAGRVGFAPYQLQNNSAEIRRLKQRINDLQARKADKTTETFFSGGRIVDNVEDNRVQIFFDAKPDTDTISRLKAAAFKWAPSIGAWQRMRGPDASRRATEIARQVVGKEEKSEKPLYSVEYLAAKYTAKAIRAGYNLLRKGVTRFADWAKEMLKQLGKSIGPKLRAMFTDLTAVLKSRTGAISGRPADSVPKSFGIQSKELQWIKDNKDLLRLTRNGKTLATLERRKPGGWRWAEANKAWARNELAIAKATVKSTIYEELKRSERETAKYQKAQEKAQKEAEAKKHKHDDYFNQPLSSRVSTEEKPLSWKDQVNNFVTKVHDAMYDRWAKGKRLIEAAVTEKNLKEIPESENFYQYLEILANRTANRTEMFKDENFKPIIDYLNKNKISYKEFNRFLRVMHAEERNEHIFNINPQFRQRAIEEPDNPMYAGSGITTKEARAEIEKMQADGTFDKFFEAGAMYWDLNNKLLDLQVKYGLMPADVRDAIKSKYTFYAPLKSMTDDATGLDWRALGRRSESSDQLAHTEKAIDATFSYGENARMRRAFAKFAINNPNPALYEMHRAVKKPYFDENTGEVKYRLDAYADRENMVYVPTSTGAIILTVKDPDLLRILKNQNDAEVGALLPYLRIVNRAAAAMHTAYSPEFLINNLIVDAQGAGIALSAEQSSEMAANVILGLPSAAIVAGKYKAGVKNENTALFREFIEQGGKTGFRDVHKLADAAKLLEKRMMEAQKGGIVYQTKEMVKDIGSLVSDINDVVEAATRFSTYREAKKAGLSKGKAAALAANVTINFQKRGTWGQIINTLYLFGTANLGGQLKLATVMASASRTKMGRAAIAGGIALGFMLDLFNRMISDFDPEEERLYWDNLSSFEKDSNYIVMMPGGKDGYVKLPMPRGFNFLPAIGRNLAAMMFGQQALGKTAQNIASAFINTASPIGADERGLSATLTPFAFKLPYDLITNTNWMGKRIRPAQPPFASPKPASELFNPNTNKVLVEITRALNSIAGGNKRVPSTRFTDLSPADVQYVIEYLTGGAGKFIGRSIDAAWRLGAGEPIRASDVPFARRVIGSGRDYSVFDRFAENRTWVKRFAEAKAEKDTAWMQKYSWLGLTTDLFKATDKKLNEIAGNKTLTQDQKREAAILEQKRFNREFEQIKKQYEGKNVPIVESSGRAERRTRRRPTRRPSRR